MLVDLLHEVEMFITRFKKYEELNNFILKNS